MAINIKKAVQGVLRKMVSGALGMELQSQWTSLTGNGSTSSGNVRNPYELSVIVYACIKFIAENIARTPFRLEKVRDDGTSTYLTKGEYFDVWRNPNPYQTGWDFVENVVSWWMYRGEAIIILERESIFSAPKRMWIFDPWLFSPVYKKNDGVSTLIGWTYQSSMTSNTGVFISLSNVIHLKSFNPKTVIRGFSPIKPAQLSIDQEFNAAVFNKSFFENGAVMSGFIIAKEDLDDDSYDKLYQTWYNGHAGSNKAHKIGILEGGQEFKPTNFSHKDMDFSVLLQNTATNIMMAYGVNEVALGNYMRIKSYEGINAALRSAWHECLIPKEDYIEYVFNAKLFPNGKQRVKFDRANIESLKEDMFRKLEIGQLLFNLTYTPVQINTRFDLGMPKNEWGDVAYIKSDRVPVGSLEDTKRLLTQQPTEEPPEDEPPEEDEDNDEKTDTEKFVSDIKNGLTKFNNKVTEIISKNEAILENAKSIESNILTEFKKLKNSYAKELKKFFIEEKNRVLENFYIEFNTEQEKEVKERKIKENVENIFDEIEEREKFTEIVAALYLLSMESGAELIADELGIQDFIFDENLPEYQNILSAKLSLIPQEVISNVKERLLSDLQEGIANSETSEQLVNRIKDFYVLFAEKHIPVIVDTEAFSTLNSGRFAQMQIQKVAKHQWFTTENEKVRPTHRLLHMQIAEVGEFFINSSGESTPLRYPGDVTAPANEVANCKCWTVAVA